MSEPSVQCPNCGATTGMASRYCGSCGNEIARAVDLFTDPNAGASGALTGALAGRGATGYGYSIGTSPGGEPEGGPTDETQFRGRVDDVVPITGVGTPTAPGGSGLKVAAGVLAALVLVCVLLVAVLLTRSSPPPEPPGATPVAPTTEVISTVAPTTATSTTRITLPTSTTSPHLLGNALGPDHDAEVEALDRMYDAIVRSDWDYARAHFVNAEGRGPSESDQWWESQYGTIEEYWFTPVRASGGTIWIGLVTHESNAQGQYSYQFCIPFNVSGTGFVRQSGQAVAHLTAKTPGAWIDPQQGMAPLRSC